jgi:hypothetical protein
MKKLLYIIVAIIVTSCSSVQIASDFDSQVDFTKFKTYALTEESKNLPIGELNMGRLINAVETELATKGFTKSDNPDVLIDMHITAKTRTEATAYNTGGYGRYGYGGGFSTTQVSYNQYTDGTLLINMIEKSTEKIAWQGRGTKTLDENASAEKRESNINYAVKQIFTKYPPKK